MSGWIGNRKLIPLFACNLVVLIIGMGLFPLLPLYAEGFGATPTMIGVTYAMMYVASVAGTIVTGWLGPRMSPRVLFMAAGVLGVISLVGLGLASALWQITLFAAVIWFCGAITIPLVAVFASALAHDGGQGRSFTLMYLAYPLGALLGGATVGQIVAWEGYGAMFFTLAGIWTVLPAVGLIALKDADMTAPAARPAVGERPSGRFGPTFYLLLLAFLLSAIAGGAGRLGTSLSMQALDFTPSAVSSTATISGLVAIPVMLAMGGLSDRWGYKRVLGIGYLLTATGAGVLLVSTSLWHFWLVATLLMAAFCVNFSVASAFGASMLASEVRSRGLPWINAMDSVASIIAFVGAGVVMDIIGSTFLYGMAVAIAGLALILLSRIRPEQRKHAVHVTSGLAATTGD